MWAIDHMCLQLCRFMAHGGSAYLLQNRTTGMLTFACMQNVTIAPHCTDLLFSVLFHRHGFYSPGWISLKTLTSHYGMHLKDVVILCIFVYCLYSCLKHVSICSNTITFSSQSYRDLEVLTVSILAGFKGTPTYRHAFLVRTSCQTRKSMLASTSFHPRLRSPG